jgi:tetratricopeptide (TPR) repeat protein
MGRGLGWGCLALWLIVPLAASAQEAEDEGEQAEGGEVAPPEAEPSEEELNARAHFTAGRNHFERGRYDLALAEFEASYELSQDPDLQYNIYLAHERLGNLDQAATALEHYLPHAGASQAALTERLENVQARLAEQQRAADAEAERRRAEEERLRRAEAATGVSTGAVIGLVAGGVGLVTFGVFAILSETEDGNLAESCGSGAGRTCSSDDISQLETYNLVADIGLAVGVAGAAVGVVFLLLGSGDPLASEAPSVAGWLSPNGGGVAFRETF